MKISGAFLLVKNLYGRSKAQAKKLFELLNPEVKKQNICAEGLKKISTRENDTALFQSLTSAPNQRILVLYYGE